MTKKIIRFMREKTLAIMKMTLFFQLEQRDTQHLLQIREVYLQQINQVLFHLILGLVSGLMLLMQVFLEV